VSLVKQNRAYRTPVTEMVDASVVAKALAAIRSSDTQFTTLRQASPPSFHVMSATMTSCRLRASVTVNLL